MRNGWLALWCVALGCSESGMGEGDETASRQVREPHVGKYRGRPSALGASCDEGGAAQCETGVCLKVSAVERTRGSICSRRCDISECPEGWRCTQLRPGADVCVPEVAQ